MNWVKKCKLSTTEALKFNGQPYNNLDDLWYTLHHSYNSAQNRPINLCLLNKILPSPTVTWPLFSDAEVYKTLNKCSNSSVLGPDHLSWRHLKRILNDEECIINIVNIANTCINLSYWPTHFKKSFSIFIPKLNKLSYDTPKSFWPIVLLNTIGKLIEKAISNRIQVYSIVTNFLHLNQLGGICQRSTTDTEVFLTYVVHVG